MVSARRGTLRLLRALMVGAIVVPATLFAYVAWVSWNQISSIADDRLVRTLDVLHEQALKVLTTGSLVLDEVVDAADNLSAEALAAREPQFHPRLKRMADLLPEVQSIWIIDRDGLPVASSYFAPAPRTTPLTDRDFFRTQREQDRGLYVSGILTPRLVEGPAFFSMSRRLRDPAGGFNGVATVSMLPSDFEKFYAELARAPREFYTLTRDDGAVLARHPGGARALPRLDPAGEPFLASRGEGPERGLYTAAGGSDGAERRIGYRRVDGYPVYVLAGLETAALHEEWRAALLGHLVFGLPATLLLLGVLWFAHQRTRSLYAEASRRQVAETALRQAQRLEAVGRLTGGVAHDFNNLLMVISGSAARLRRSIDGEKETRLVEMIAEAARRGETLTRQLLSFSRQQSVSPRSIDLTVRLPELSDLVRRSLGDDVEVQIDVPDHPCPVKVDPGEFELAVMNICVNARDAMPKGGRLTVRVRDLMLDETADGGLFGRFVGVAFADSGTGIAADVLPRVFEPFFTTKDNAKGTGLGLSQVYGFARQAGGDVRIESRVGHGTVVTLWLPHVPLETAAPEPSPTPVATTEERRSVLVVEDNQAVAEVCRSYLDQLGWDMIFAASPREALASLGNGHAVDIVLSDILMPGGMSGIELARELRRVAPSVPVVLMTGFNDRADEVARSGYPVLRKPFDIEALHRELTAAMARQTTTGAA
ncbi:response regulator [Rhodoplanes serenus]|uniref:histidine kinase n=1 Tax=Rhodoplanes serenus TaxID=200615 RepID=A0A9X4XN72_9BRAD|nr:ATP-binding protein [Rhodoplanes serenus]MTW18238.1 response regulator [Rhodoplanes serenus]